MKLDLRYVAGHAADAAKMGALLIRREQIRGGNVNEQADAV